METAGSHRPWEADRSSLPNKGPQTLPSISTLTANISNPASQSPLNVSASSSNWATPQSTGSSVYSAGPYPNTSPNRFSGPQYSADQSAPPLSSPSYNPNVQTQPLPSLNQTFDPINHNRGSGDYEDSRRSSIDSRMNQGMDRLALSTTSPYASANVSQTSLVSGLQKERGIQTNGSYRGPRYSGHSASSVPLSPLGPRSSRGGFAPGRIAPPIIENPRSEVYNAPAPTAGQPYAFPDPDLDQGKVEPRPGSTYSRRNSYAESFSSSLFTSDSRLPPGQQELPDAGTHHHSLQHKQVRGVIDDEGDSPGSNTPYSRTPELRVTHKLAERKRRSEMKGCFEALRVRLPANQTNKSSKWEVLSRAIDYITSLENQNGKYRGDVEHLKQQNKEMEMRMKEMMQQLQKVQQGGAASYETPPNQITPMFGNHNQYGNGAEPPRTLPPLMNGVAMQGVQYQDDRR